MEWGAEQIALAIAGVLFLLAVVATLDPRLALSLSSRIVLSAAAGAYVAAAMGFQHIKSSAVVPLLWIVPLSVAVVVTRDVVTKRELRGAHFFPGRRHRRFAGHDVNSPEGLSEGGPTTAGHPDTAVQVVGPTTSSAELEQLAYTHPDARLAIALHADTPSSVLSWLASHGDPAVVEAIAARQESPDAATSER